MVLELTIRFLRKIATPSLFIFLLLLGVVASVAFGLSEMIRGLTFDPLFRFAFIGLLLGWLLARTRVRVWLAAIFLPLLGVGLVYLWVGKLVLPVLNFARALVQVGWIYLQQRTDFVLDLTSVELTLSELSARSHTTWSELQLWIHSIASDQPIFQMTAALLIWGLLIWLISTWAGWVQRRNQNAVLSIAPGCILLITALGYTYTVTTALLPLFFCALLLIAFTWLNINQAHWEAAEIDYPEDARFDSVFAFVGLTVVLVVAAYFLPRISIRKIVETVREFTNPQVEQAAPFVESFGIEANRPSIGRFGSMLNAGLPRSHLIGSGPELSEQVVMSVQITDGLPPGAEVSDTIPLYWRGLTYDHYNGSGWDSSEVTLHRYHADQQIGMFERPGYWIVEQQFSFIDKSELLFAAGDLIGVDENYQVAWRSEPWQSEIERFPGDFFGASTDQLSYRAQSFIPVVDENTLRGTSWLYPDWIRENYVLVPVQTPQRVVNLTRQLIAGLDNPYDRARAIERYLRQFEYTTDLPEPPLDRDIVDYFLFDLKKGYCDYFASAMVVMARAADLPARLVVGYARGAYDTANDRYVVTEAEAHSWPEIYFAGVGWVPFEPTSGRKEITRSEIPLQFPGNPAYAIEAESLMGGIKPLFGSWLITFAITVVGLIWIWMIWITLDEWRLKRLSPEGMITRLYQRLYRHGKRLGTRARKEDTPNDFALSLRRQFASFSGRSLGYKSMRQARKEVRNLAKIYTHAQFSQRALQPEEQEQTLAIWQRLRRKLVLARGLYWLQKLKPRKSKDLE